MNTKNIIIIGVLIFGVYMIFFNKKKSNKIKEYADTKLDEGCGCGKNIQPEVAPEL